jgi:nitrile hydratase
VNHSDVNESDHSHLSDVEARVRALESLLTEKGYLDPASIDALVDTYETKIGPRNGAKVVAKAWSDEDFGRWMREDVTAAIASLGLNGNQGAHYNLAENTPDVHNMVVCTLCSCYPWPLLGLPPVWYKAAPYRARVMNDPRGVLAEFGVMLPESTRIRVWDSTSEVRHLVFPMRPEGTEGWSEDDLAALVTRDSMIGTGLALTPEEVRR